MDIDINVGKCSNCKGIDKCNKYCALHAGKTLVDYLTRVDMIETRIGEFSSRVKGGKTDLVVSGHQLYDLNTPSWLLTDISTTLDVTPKFRNLFGKNPSQLITAYGNSVGMNKEEIAELVDKLAKLNKNKLLVLPFKPHTNCNIDIEVDGNQIKKKDVKISSLRWHTSAEKYKLLCEVAIEVDSPFGKKIHRQPIVKYLETWSLSAIDMQAKGDKHDNNVIKITDHGIIKPLAIISDNNTVAIDANYVYLTTNNDTRIIGYWDANDKLIISDTKSAACKKILDNLNFIKSHKKYMAPYLLYEANEIRL